MVLTPDRQIKHLCPIKYQLCPVTYFSVQYTVKTDILGVLSIFVSNPATGADPEGGPPPLEVLRPNILKFSNNCLPQFTWRIVSLTFHYLSYASKNTIRLVSLDFLKWIQSEG